MGNVIGGLLWLIIVLGAILFFATGLLIAYFIFKLKCKIMADVVAERIREELDDIINNLEIKTK
jgi:hypothetical protein